MRTITLAVRSLDHSPDRGRPAPDGARELIVPFGGSTYIVRYPHFRAEREIAILRIWHGLENRD